MTALRASRMFRIYLRGLEKLLMHSLRGPRWDHNRGLLWWQCQYVKPLDLINIIIIDITVLIH